MDYLKIQPSIERALLLLWLLKDFGWMTTNVYIGWICGLLAMILHCVTLLFDPRYPYWFINASIFLWIIGNIIWMSIEFLTEPLSSDIHWGPPVPLTTLSSDCQFSFQIFKIILFMISFLLQIMMYIGIYYNWIDKPSGNEEYILNSYLQYFSTILLNNTKNDMKSTHGNTGYSLPTGSKIFNPIWGKSDTFARINIEEDKESVHSHSIRSQSMRDHEIGGGDDEEEEVIVYNSHKDNKKSYKNIQGNTSNKKDISYTYESKQEPPISDSHEDPIYFEDRSTHSSQSGQNNNNNTTTTTTTIRLNNGDDINNDNGMSKPIVIKSWFTMAMIDNLYIQFWILKDLFWSFGTGDIKVRYLPYATTMESLALIFGFLAFLFQIIPTIMYYNHIIIALDCITTLLWISANYIWMMGEFFLRFQNLDLDDSNAGSDESARIFSMILFCLGIFIQVCILIYMGIQQFFPSSFTTILEVSSHKESSEKAEQLKQQKSTREMLESAFRVDDEEDGDNDDIEEVIINKK